MDPSSSDQNVRKVQRPDASSKVGRKLPRLERTAFKTSRLLDFFSVKKLTTQTGHEPREWPLVAL